MLDTFKCIIAMYDIIITANYRLLYQNINVVRSVFGKKWSYLTCSKYSNQSNQSVSAIYLESLVSHEDKEDSFPDSR